MTTAKNVNLLRVQQRENILHLVRDFLKQEGYIEIEIPELVVSTGACEVISSMFDVDYFGNLVFLRQTGQLYLEELVVQGMDKVYCEGESFRKEPHADDGRHLCEFRLIEIEAKNMDLDGLVQIEENTLKYVVKNLDINLFDESNLERLHKETNGTLPRVTYREALRILEEVGLNLKFGDDINREAEQMLIRHFGMGAVAITHYPTEMKFFNMATNREDPTICNCCDFILKYSGETFGSAVRETEIDIMRQRLHRAPMYQLLLERARSFVGERAKINNYSYEWLKEEQEKLIYTVDESFEDYFRLFENNPIRRAGYGLGLARLYQYIMGLESVNDAVTFPITRTAFGK